MVVRPITTRPDRLKAAQFLSANLNARVPVEAWFGSATAGPAAGGDALSGWDLDPPNRGMMLVDGADIVGVYVATYSWRRIAGELERICNLGAWCVSPERRFHSVRLLKALLAQNGFHFVDLSPSGNVVPLNERLGFRHLDTSTALVPTHPWVWYGSVCSDRAQIEARLTGRDRQFFRDHPDVGAAQHLLLTRGGRKSYVVFRMDRRKGWPVFASILHVSEAGLFHELLRPLAGFLLTRYRAVAVLAELRVVGRRPRGSMMLSTPRRKMFRSSTLAPDDIDYFYSELISVPW